MYELVELIAVPGVEASTAWVFVSGEECYAKLQEMKQRPSIGTLYVCLMDGHCVGYLSMSYFKDLETMERYKIFPAGTKFYHKRPMVSLKELRSFFFTFNDSALSLAKKRPRTRPLKQKVEPVAPPAPRGYAKLVTRTRSSAT